MMKSSIRGQELSQSPIRSLIPYARKAKEKGVEILHLNIGQPDIPTPVAALDRVKSMQDEVISYVHLKVCCLCENVFVNTIQSLRSTLIVRVSW